LSYGADREEIYHNLPRWSTVC